MKVMLKVNIPLEEGNRKLKEGKLIETIQAILEIQKPDAAYFCEDDGKRTAFIFVQVKDDSELFGLAEPWFIAFKAYVELRPIMTFAELEKAVPSIKKVVEKLVKT
jgi:hypothetical protein